MAEIPQAKVIRRDKLQRIPWIAPLEAIANRVSALFSIIAMIALAAMAIHIFWDVISRAFFNAPLPATLEFVVYIYMPTIIFLSLSQAQRHGEHLQMSLAFESLPPKQKLPFNILFNILATIVVLLLLPYTWKAAIESWQIGEAALAAISVPVWPGKFVLALGLLMFAVQTLMSLLNSARQVSDEGLRDSNIKEAENDS